MQTILSRRWLLTLAVGLVAIATAATMYVTLGRSAAQTPVPAPHNGTPVPVTGPGTNVPGLSNDKVQEGIRKAKQARQKAIQQFHGGQQGQSVADSQAEIVDTWKRLTGNLLAGELTVQTDQTVTFAANGTFTTDVGGKKLSGNYRSLGGHEYGLQDKGNVAGVYVMGDYLFVANGNGAGVFGRAGSTIFQ